MLETQNISETAPKTMLLPQGMHKNVLQSLSSKHNTQELCFRTIFIKNLKDETGEIVIDLIQPRYIHLYSESSSEVRDAFIEVKSILSDSFDYEVSVGDDLPQSEEVSNDAGLLTHYRSRCIAAKTLINSSLSHDEKVAYLLKSSLAIHIVEAVSNNIKSFTAISTVVPRTGDLISNSGVLHYTSPLEAMEKLLKNETTPYNKIIDLNFDTVVIKFNKFEGEFEPPMSSDDFMDFFRRKVITQDIHL